MKLRIQDNSIRVRLSIEELEELKNRKETFMVSYLGPSPLTTRIIAVEDGSKVSFNGDEIRLFLTAKSISDLYNSDKEGIYLCHQVTDSIRVSLSIEKDYKCIGREDQLNEGLYPNPKEEYC